MGKTPEQYATEITAKFYKDARANNHPDDIDELETLITEAISQALLAAEQRAQQGWWSEHSCSEAAIRRAKIWAAHEANRTGANEPRTVLKLLDALVSAPNTPDAGITATDYQRGFADGVARTLDEKRNELLVLEFLTEQCAYFYGESYGEPSPREFGIAWGWQDNSTARPSMWEKLVEEAIDWQKRLNGTEEDTEE